MQDSCYVHFNFLAAGPTLESITLWKSDQKLSVQ